MKNLIHDLVGLNPSTPLAKINALTNEQLSIAVENYECCDEDEYQNRNTDEWIFKLSEKIEN